MGCEKNFGSGAKGGILLSKLKKIKVKNLHLSTNLHQNSHGVSVFRTELNSISGFITKSVFSNSSIASTCTTRYSPLHTGLTSALYKKKFF